ncbi:hypothetical protein GEMRC1_010344 [Eukaryota sp. GEM-RC1]
MADKCDGLVRQKLLPSILSFGADFHQRLFNKDGTFTQYYWLAPENNRLVKRWLPLLSPYHFEIYHVEGKENAFADLLSRLICRNEVKDSFSRKLPETEREKGKLLANKLSERKAPSTTFKGPSSLDRFHTDLDALSVEEVDADCSRQPLTVDYLNDYYSSKVKESPKVLNLKLFRQKKDKETEREWSPPSYDAGTETTFYYQVVEKTDKLCPECLSDDKRNELVYYRLDDEDGIPAPPIGYIEFCRKCRYQQDARLHEESDEELDLNREPTATRSMLETIQPPRLVQGPEDIVVAEHSEEEPTEEESPELDSTSTSKINWIDELELKNVLEKKDTDPELQPKELVSSPSYSPRSPSPDLDVEAISDDYIYLQPSTNLHGHFIPDERQIAKDTRSILKKPTSPNSTEVEGLIAVKSLLPADGTRKNEDEESWIAQLRFAQSDHKDDEFKKTLQDLTTRNRLNWNADLSLYTNENHKIITPKNFRRNVLIHIHGLPTAGHPNARDSIKRLRESDFWWPRMENDMKELVANCPSCQKTAPLPCVTVGTTGNLQAKRPFECIHADSIGPLPKDVQGYKYLVVFVDAFSRYTILVPLAELNANEVAYAMLEKVCSIFGVPEKLHSDNGPEFPNAIMKQLMKFLNITIQYSTPYYHQCNGLVERRNRAVINTLRKLLADFNDHSNWRTYIPMTQLLLNTTVRKRTGFTPYELIFGTSTDPRNPPTSIIAKLTSDFDEKSSWIGDLEARTNLLLRKWEEAGATQDSVIQKELEKINSLPLVGKFQVGDYVIKQSRREKLQTQWVGPYLIIAEGRSATAWKLKDLITGHERYVSARHLRLYRFDPNDDPSLLRAVAAQDRSEFLVTRILREFKDGRVEVMFGNEPDIVPLEFVKKNTAAYQEFLRTQSRPQRVPKRKKK